MTKLLLIALLSAALVAPSASAAEKKKSKPKKPETGASCKAPAIGRCAACSITCPPGETATCSGGQALGEACHAQPSCRGSK